MHEDCEARLYILYLYTWLTETCWCISIESIKHNGTNPLTTLRLATWCVQMARTAEMTWAPWSESEVSWATWPLTWTMTHDSFDCFSIFSQLEYFLGSVDLLLLTSNRSMLWCWPFRFTIGGYRYGNTRQGLLLLAVSCCRILQFELSVCPGQGVKSNLLTALQLAQKWENISRCTLEVHPRILMS